LWGREVEEEEDREVIGNEGGKHGTTNPWQASEPDILTCESNRLLPPSMCACGMISAMWSALGRPEEPLSKGHLTSADIC